MTKHHPPARTVSYYLSVTSASVTALRKLPAYCVSPVTCVSQEVSCV